MVLRAILGILLALASVTAGAVTVSGKISHGTAALPGMTVAVYTTAGVLVTSATTSFTGSYTLSLPVGEYRFLAFDGGGNYATNFHPNADSFETSTVVLADRNLPIDFSMVRAGYLAGRVRSSGGTALSGMTIAVYNTSGTERGRTKSDAEGNYRIVLPPGSFRAAAWDDALVYLPRFTGGSRTFEGASSLGITAAVTTQSDFELPRASHIHGTVSDALTGAPLAAVRVSAYDVSGAARTAGTSGDGSYRLALEPGSYRLVFYDPSGVYAAHFHPGASSYESSGWVTLGSVESKAVSAGLTAAGSLRGRVTDIRTGVPLAGVQVVAYNLDGTVRARSVTDATGIYSLVVPGGTYRLGVHDDLLRYAPLFYPAAVRFSDASSIQAIPGAQTPGIDLALSPAGYIRALVSDAATGTPIAGIGVEIRDLTGATLQVLVSGDDGEVRPAIAPGTYSVVAWHPGGAYQPVAVASVVVAEGAQADVSLRMEKTVAARRRTARSQ